MKRYLLALTIVCNIAVAQNRTNIWMMGYNFTQTFPDLGFDFTDDTLHQFTFQRPMGFFLTDASICDTNGNLLFYTNGITIENANHDTLNSSVEFNPGYSTDYYDNGITGLGINGGAIIIPRPDYPDQYYLFHESGEIFATPFGIDVNPLELRYSLIDMTLDGGLGGIPTGKKKVVAINDTLSFGRIAACKHANGRDWWVLVHQYYNNKYYKLLVTPDSIYGAYEQQIGFDASNNDALGAGLFTPDGSKYIMMETRDSIDIFDFDRCTGELSNEVFVFVPDSFNGTTTGAGISPNGRFLYVVDLINIFQYDLWSSDIPNSGIIVAELDSSLNSLYWFGQLRPGPDNKIYVATYSATIYMHVIESPDSLGLACNVIQAGLHLLNYNQGTVPCFPNYDLGALEGSPCDTLDNHVFTISKDFGIQLSPNPSSSLLNIEYQSDQTLQMHLFDIIGKQRKQITLYSYFRNRLLHVEDLPEGIYLAVFTLNNQTVKTQKVSIVR